MKHVVAALAFLAFGLAAQAQEQESPPTLNSGPLVVSPEVKVVQRPAKEDMQRFVTPLVKGLVDKAPAAPSSCTALKGTVSIGTFSSFLGDSGSCLLALTNGSVYSDFYAFQALAGQTVVIRYAIALADPVLFVQSYSDGSILAQAHTTGSPASLTFTFPSTATYIVSVSTLTLFGTGNYTLALSSGASIGTPNLMPFNPTGNYSDGPKTWSDKIVVSTAAPTSTASVVDTAHITTADTLFASWAGNNAGTATVPSFIGALMQNGLYLDGVRVQWWTGPGDGAGNNVDWLGNSWIDVTGFRLGSLSAGSHTLELRLDETNVVSESNESDNRYVKTFAVSSSTAATCTTSANNLCLNAGRFHVVVAYSSSTASGNGAAIPLTADTGYFWFFSSSNVEMVVKVVDGRAVNGKFWVFAGGLTNVGVTITVTDTQTGAVRLYVNPPSTAFQPIQDTSAF